MSTPTSDMRPSGQLPSVPVSILNFGSHNASRNYAR